MKKEFAKHFLALAALLVGTIFIKGWFDLSYWPFLVGGVVGTILPDLDHLVYLYLNPQELTSQRTIYSARKGDIMGAFRLLSETRTERKNLIFHSFLFQVVFLLLTVFVLTSSGSLFGRGLTLAFYLHLLLDMIIDWKETGSLENWFKSFSLDIPNDKIRLFVILNVVVFLVLTVLF